MKRPVSILFFALIGILMCVGLVLITDWLQMTPHFPAFAGEDDFALRIKYFFFTALPAFGITGAWIGCVFSVDKRVASYMWAGVLGGSVLTFSLAHVLSPVIVGISSRDAANYGVLTLFLCWILFSALGAVVLRMVFRRSLRAKLPPT